MMAVPGRWNERTDRIVQSTEIKQRQRIAAADFHTIGLGNLGCVEPSAALRVILEWIINCEQHAVSTDGQHRGKERRWAEMAARCYGKIIAEKFAHGGLGRA